MTEFGWHTSRNIKPMLTYLTDVAFTHEELGSTEDQALLAIFSRKFRLFLCACHRRHSVCDCEHCHTVINAVEANAHRPGLCNRAMQSLIAMQRNVPGHRRDQTDDMRRIFYTTFICNPSELSLMPTNLLRDVRSYNGRAFLLREFVRFFPWQSRGLYFDDWIKPRRSHRVDNSAYAMAVNMYCEKTFDALPILADKLEEDGCDDVELMQHLRGKVICFECRTRSVGCPNPDCYACHGTGWKTNPCSHARGCWALDEIMQEGDWRGDISDWELRATRRQH